MRVIGNQVKQENHVAWPTTSYRHYMHIILIVCHRESSCERVLQRVSLSRAILVSTPAMQSKVVFLSRNLTPSRLILIPGPTKTILGITDYVIKITLRTHERPDLMNIAYEVASPRADEYYTGVSHVGEYI
jgi:hypothetical protein